MKPFRRYKIVFMGGDQRMIPDVFLCCFPSYVLRQGLLLNLGPANVARLASCSVKKLKSFYVQLLEK